MSRSPLAGPLQMLTGTGGERSWDRRKGETVGGRLDITDHILGMGDDGVSDDRGIELDFPLGEVEPGGECGAAVDYYRSIP